MELSLLLIIHVEAWWRHLTAPSWWTASCARTAHPSHLRRLTLPRGNIPHTVQVLRLYRRPHFPRSCLRCYQLWQSPSASALWQPWRSRQPWSWAASPCLAKRSSEHGSLSPASVPPLEASPPPATIIGRSAWPTPASERVAPPSPCPRCFP